MLIFLLLSIYIWPSRTGSIQTWDIEVDYTNSAYASQFKIPFSLSNGLDPRSYLKIVFPFSLNYKETNSIPDGLTGAYQMAVGDHACGKLSEETTQIYSNIAKEPNTYYIKFPSHLLPKQFYILILTIYGNNLNI